MNVSFTDKQEKYIASLVDSGDYQNASEAVRDAIRLHQKYREKIIDDLRIEIEKGWDGPESSRSVQDIIAAKSRKGVH
ncbi:MAG: type II toxin-antitoxin system ParD family antitoxin [Bacteroidota bacterium]